MRIAIGLPSRIPDASGELMLEWATRAEQGPFSSLVVTDRVVSRSLEPLAVLALAAGATRRIRLMTSVVIGPTRETTLLARQAATIDVVSGGRLTLGIGIGVRTNDYLATGFDFHRRGKISEEQFALLRRLWRGETLSSEVGPIGPPSPRPGGPELLIGGYVPAIVQRIASWGDGYMAPGGGEPEAMLRTWREIELAWQRAGRSGKPRWVGASYFALGPNAADHAKRYIGANYGYNPELAAKRLRTLPASPAAVEEAIKRQADMGVDEFILRPCAEDLDQMDLLAEVAARVS
ncbi:MAG TPA: LLM class flavin-dependent oxidoreductase [Candidatus Binatia bacterium]|jgi:alkanesulfonate monooxygenase SsuD/methylene tetrahydromethanopterin reductase-like flavin-dependent oxidoreductase (luciferase family)|nr:LLM class flavin-dependent oxidoreductase [Candidatus Binatia bacterium]